MQDSAILQPKNKKYNDALKGLVDVLKEPEGKLIDLLRRTGVHNEDIANAMGISKQRLSKLYPVEGGEK